MEHYINFIESMPRDRALSKEFKRMIKYSSAPELSRWFTIKGYQVSVEDCDAILENNRNNFYLMDEAIPYLFLTK
jgi:hypothetical protein